MTEPAAGSAKAAAAPAESATADKPVEAPAPHTEPATAEEAGREETGEEEPEETCGFCRFMKAGPCREVFVAWEKCVDKHREAGDDFVEACVPFTHGLKECMEANSEYYGALLDDAEEGDDTAEQTEDGALDASAPKAEAAAEQKEARA